MKRTEKATDTILVKAYTNSEWDRCDFAIVHCGEAWKNLIRKRMEAIQPIAEDSELCSVRYYDASVDFFQTDDKDILKLLEQEDWTFIEMDEDEERTLVSPENRLDTYRLYIFPKGGFMYSAFGKHTGEEFWTEELTFTDIANR
ncbi:MAG: hypothetical protein SPJ99_02005 [Candidatus Coprenecus sp.]|nr:hypothetical protein [Candidatus Coprenecus sp.]